MPFTDPSFVRHDLPFICSLATIVVVASCQLSRKGEIDPTQPPLVDVSATQGDALAADAPLKVKPPLMPEEPLPASPQTMVGMVGVRNGQRHTGFTVRVLDCNVVPNNSLVQLETTLTSDFGTQNVHLTLRGTGAGEAVRADVEAYRMSFAVATPVKAMIAVQACTAAKTHATEFVVEPTVMEETRSWLSQIAPDCVGLGPSEALRVGPPAPNETNSGWQCHLPEADPATALSELVGIRVTMIRRWSRQPYLLARRLALGVDLAQTLLSPNPDKKLDTFCRIVSSSLPIELPAALASKRWQAAVCGQDKSHRLSAARFGLGKTVTEIDFMRQLFDRTSRLGFLTLRIPANEAPARDILVSLTPLAEVTDNVARETAHLWQAEEKNPVARFEADSPRSCWHPVFAEDSGLMRLGRYLTLAGESPRVACEDSDMVPNEAFAPAQYFAESITSETEFIATNGRAKTLRLPIGRYAYKLHVLPENPEDWDDASQTLEGSTGEIVWDAKRPRPTITSW